MFIFLDESGELGVDFEVNDSSPYFCITLLLCRNRKTFLKINSTVKNTLLRKFNIKKTKVNVNELKGYKTTLDVKKYFYRQLLKGEPDEQRWEIYSIVIDKLKVLPLLKTMPNKQRLYNIIAKDVLELIDFSHVDDNQVILFADSCKGSKERKIFGNYSAKLL